MILVDIQKEDPVEAVRAATGGAGVDEVFECSGSEGTLNQAIRMVREGGRIGLLGVPTEKVMEKIPFKYVCRNEIAIFGSKANPNVSDKSPFPDRLGAVGGQGPDHPCLPSGGVREGAGYVCQSAGWGDEGGHRAEWA